MKTKVLVNDIVIVANFEYFYIRLELNITDILLYGDKF